MCMLKEVRSTKSSKRSASLTESKATIPSAAVTLSSCLTCTYIQPLTVSEMMKTLSSLCRIAVICAPHPFCYGTSNPRGPLAVKIRHLKLLELDHVLVRLSLTD